MHSAPPSESKPAPHAQERAKIDAATTARLIERVTAIYKRYAPGLWKRSPKLGYLEAFNSMIPRYLDYRFGSETNYDEYTRRTDYTIAVLHSALQPRDRFYICGAVEDLLEELVLQHISYSELHDALYAPLWDVERALQARRVARHA